MATMLIDANVLVYGHDRGSFAKQGQAIETLHRLQINGAGRLSAQCLAEFYVAVTRGAQPILPAAEAAQQVDRLARAFRVFDITPMIVLEATRGAREHLMPYWDAQIWATARLNQVPLVLSEDFSAGSSVEGVRFLNPFATGFDLEEWLT
jgi:predicted nucleic acid-binding protein